MKWILSDLDLDPIDPFGPRDPRSGVADGSHRR
jgi:hypothetical protein